MAVPKYIVDLSEQIATLSEQVHLTAEMTVENQCLAGPQRIPDGYGDPDGDDAGKPSQHGRKDSGLAELPEHVTTLARAVEELERRHSTCPISEVETLQVVLKRRVEDYPTLTWLLRYRTRNMILTLLFFLLFGFIIFSPIIDPRLLNTAFQLFGNPFKVLPLS